MDNSMGIRDIRGMLDQIEADLIARVPEHMFVQHILPIIAAEPGHTSLEPWEHLAGSTFNSMHVIDRSGNVMFTVPPMAVSPRLDQDREARNSLYEIMEHYKLLANVSVIQARAYLDNKLQSLIRLQSRNFETLSQIDDILERYNKERRLPKDFYEKLRRQQAGETESAPVTVETVQDGDIGDDL